MFRATLRILAGMLLGVLIAWLVHGLRTPEDPREMAKRYMTLTVNGNFSPEEIRQLRQKAEDDAVRAYLKNKHPHQDRVYFVLSAIFFASIFGMLTAYSLLFDFKTLGLMKRQRARALDASQL